MAERYNWDRQFEGNVSRDPTARRAWAMLVDAGLETAALRTLWTYAHPPTNHLSEGHRRVNRINREIKALIRAGEIEKVKRNANDPRADMFFDRYWRQHLAVVRAPMPFGDVNGTVGDWVLRQAAICEGMPLPGLPELRKIFVSLGKRCPISDRKLWLFLLRCFAANAGLTIGLKRLSTLANCADPDHSLDERTLARYIKSLPPRFQISCCRDLHYLPPPPLFPPQD